jgi:hypothetical protein
VQAISNSPSFTSDRYESWKLLVLFSVRLRSLASLKIVSSSYPKLAPRSLWRRTTYDLKRSSISRKRCCYSGQLDSTSSKSKATIQDIRNVRMLKAILHASIDENNDLAEVTKSAIDRECTRLILNRLWFRLIDDRRDSIAEVHSKTLQWAIHPPSSTVAWSDLSQWLRSEHGIHWISGKPGSGKCTLVKFLYNHQEVVEMLETGQATGI